MIIIENHPLLHKPASIVGDEMFADNGLRLKPIATLLMTTINDNSALGVSACQVGIDLSVFAMMVDGQPRVCVNPQIIAAAVEMEKQPEGCLSFPGMILNVRRPDAVAVRYKTIDGTEVTEHLDGLAARVWLHEYDHTMGICFTDRVSKLGLSMAKKKMIKNSKRNMR